jgi:branched-chain amino acid transport system ATP-binding protein
LSGGVAAAAAGGCRPLRRLSASATATPKVTVLALRPKVLLLDEPTAGMNPYESGQFNDFVNRVRDDYDLSVLLIEHDMSVIMRISERITVLDHGKLIAEGPPKQIRSDQTVIEAYLGRAGAREDRRNRS